MVEMTASDYCKVFWKELWKFRTSVIMFATPIVFIFIPFIPQFTGEESSGSSTEASDEKWASCAYIMIWMAIYWMAEVFPIAITALMPIVLFPAFGIMSGEQVARNYIKDSQMLFIGGLTIAVAVEHSNLHMRIALRVLMLVGSKARWLMLGFMSVTFFLSMWISNTATTAMMLPIVVAVLQKLMEHAAKKSRKMPRSVSQHTMSTLSGSGHQVAIGAGQLRLQRSRENLVDETSLTATPPGTPQPGANGSIIGGINMDLSPVEGEDDWIDQLSLTPWGDVPLEEYEKMPHQHFNILPGKTQGVDNSILCKAMLLCICYAANIGGTGTLTGTTPNLVLAGQVETLYGTNKDAEISYTGWMFFALPNAVICLLIAWAWLQFHFLGLETLFACFYSSEEKPKKDTETSETASQATLDTLEEEDTAHQVIQEQYKNLGPMSFAETVVLVHFVVLVLLWLTRSPGSDISGWGDLFKGEDGDSLVTDGTAAILIVLILFVCPAERPNFFCCQSSNDTSPKGPKKTVIGWDTIHEKLPWSVVFLMGGGYALADGVIQSGLSAKITEFLMFLENVPPFLLLWILCTIVSVLTEFASNTATATIMVPILAKLAEALCQHPHYFLFPGVIAASFAFTLPVATPPNAIVFSYKVLTIKDMARSGIVMNLTCAFITVCVASTFGYYAFGWEEFPKWAVDDHLNHTCFS